LIILHKYIILTATYITGLMKFTYLLKVLVVAIPAEEKGKCMALREGRLSEKQDETVMRIPESY
jgi:hypothetical protein